MLCVLRKCAWPRFRRGGDGKPHAIPHNSRVYSRHTTCYEDPGLKPCPLIDSPYWQASDLGKALPDSEHATSVAMPLWQHVIQYEEGDPEFRKLLALGYPRFVVHPLVEKLNTDAAERFAREGEAAFVAPSARVAENGLRFIHDVQTRKLRISCSLMKRPNSDAYFLPRSDKFVSPPILPAMLYSLSPCYKSKTRR